MTIKGLLLLSSVLLGSASCTAAVTPDADNDDDDDDSSVVVDSANASYTAAAAGVRMISLFEDGKTIRLHVGDKLAIDLPTSETCPSWKVESGSEGLGAPIVSIPPSSSPAHEIRRFAWVAQLGLHEIVLDVSPPAECHFSVTLVVTTGK